MIGKSQLEIEIFPFMLKHLMNKKFKSLSLK